MRTTEITMVHVYLTEGDHRLESLLACLHDEEKVSGVTTYRGISGFGKSGKIHSSTLLDMSLDLPLVIEFFDEPAKVETILEHLNKKVEPGHIVSWPARLNLGE